jgi:IS6 family transposase
LFKHRHLQYDIIIWAVRWYCKYRISYLDPEQILCERGIEVGHSTIYRWVQLYAPEIEKRLYWYWRPRSGVSWQVDETYVKVKGKWVYLYRTIDKNGRTIDFYLSSRGNAKSAKRFLGKSLRGLK